QLTDNIQIKMHDDEVAPGLEELYQNMKKTLVTASSIAAKFIDERMVSFGFITRKTGFGGVVDMINEMKQSGKITYQLRQKIEGKNIVAEIIGELDDRSNLFDHIIINKIYLKEL
ncbi:MAG TPA: type II toxin-antitoxin system Phd/YefM family antitoxin, partial [Tetragenococcus sp.]|nr:type II toxin-antitoxin system Phd/YefM family antitoxin [Tetragenococcus sp.]